MKAKKYCCEDISLIENYEQTKLDNLNQYKTEWQYWKTHNHKCHWEV